MRDDGRPNKGIEPIVRIVLLIVEIWLIAMMVILAIAFVMGLLGANTDADFSKWILNRTNDIMTPFNGIFDPVRLNGGVVLNTSLLFATLIYGIAAAAVGAFIRMLDRG